MWIIFTFYNIIIKSANMYKGEGGKTLIHKMWIKRRFFNPSLRYRETVQGKHIRCVYRVLVQGTCTPYMVHEHGTDTGCIYLVQVQGTDTVCSNKYKCRVPVQGTGTRYM